MAMTLQAIANQVGVSKMTVSAVLNNTKGVRVSAARREEILNTAQKTGYRPNLIARSLSSGCSNLIGVIIDSQAPNSCFDILRFIESAASANGYRVIVAEEHDSVDNVIKACQIFEQYRADGIICLAHDYPSQNGDFDKFINNYKNIVFLEQKKGISRPYLSVDSRSAYREALTYCKEKARVPALLIPDIPNISIRNRVVAYMEIASELGIPAHIINAPLCHDSTKLLDKMEICLKNKLLPQKINAVLAFSDQYAAAMLSTAVKHNLSVPEDMAVIGWDNSEYCALLLPKLASINNNHKEQGEKLFYLLKNLIDKGKVESVVVESKLVLEASAG